jgi:hypothetical protein
MLRNSRLLRLSFTASILLAVACAEGEGDPDFDGGTHAIPAGGTAGGGTPGGGAAAGGTSGGGTLAGATLGGGTPGAGTPAGAADGGASAGGLGGADAGRAPGQAYGDWTYYEVPGALCRDGSPAGYYLRRSKTGEKNLVIYLNGGGVCYDDFFCSINPANVNESLPGETLLAATGDVVVGALLPERQQPVDEGIFKNDPKNPVGDWNMVFVPYCTGDVHAGTKRNAPVITSLLQGEQQFVGYHNVGLFLQDFGGDYKDAEKVLLTGSSAGGFGSLLNFDRTQEFFGSGVRVYAVTDSGLPFRDMYLEPCLQKIWRELWGLDAVLPKDCTGCFNPDGGGLAQGLGDYIFKQKYKGRMLGGGISTAQDQVIKLFFSAGLEECSYPVLLDLPGSALGLSGYPAERYPAGLKDFVDSVAGRESVGSYMMEGDTHQHLFRPRFYEPNGLGKSIAEWLADTLDNRVLHLGTL